MWIREWKIREQERLREIEEDNYYKCMRDLEEDVSSNIKGCLQAKAINNIASESKCISTCECNSPL